MTPLFDSHAHLSLLKGETAPFLEKAKRAHVTHILTVATDSASLNQGKFLQTKSSSPKLFLAASTPPHDVTSEEDPFFLQVKQAAQEKVLSAIGECGLEYFHAEKTKQIQKSVFLRYASLALEENLPLIVHCRDAFPDFLAILQGISSDLRGVVHCFTGTYEHAQALLDRGWYLSFSGIITYPNSRELQEVVKKVPVDKILAETDSPFLAPQRVRGQQNEPSFLPDIVQKIAELKGLSFEETARATFLNAATLFKIIF